MKITKNSLTFNVKPCDVFKVNEHWFGGSEIFWNLLMSGGWEADTFKIFDKYASKEHSYLDIGAWVGPTVLYGAQLFKKCYAFEPDTIAFNLLKNNILENLNISNIELYSDAITDYTGQINFGTKTILGDSMSSTLWNKESTLVNCISLQDFIINNNIQDCNFIKMDIEGGEFKALPAAKNIFKQIDATLYVSLHTPFFNDKKLYLNAIMDSLSSFKYIYSSSDRKINHTDILNLSGFTSIIATNKE